MALLSEEVLEEGRALIRAKNLDGFINWIEENGIRIDREVVRETYEKCFKYNDTAMALMMFEAVFPKINPRAQAVGTFIAQGCMLFVLLGLMGGIAYLFDTCLGGG